MQRFFKIFLKTTGILILLAILIFFLYFNNTRLVSKKTVSFYIQLKDSLRSKGYNARLLVISTFFPDEFHTSQ